MFWSKYLKGNSFFLNVCLGIINSNILRNVSKERRREKIFLKERRELEFIMVVEQKSNTKTD